MLISAETKFNLGDYVKVKETGNTGFIEVIFVKYYTTGNEITYRVGDEEYCSLELELGSFTRVSNLKLKDPTETSIACYEDSEDSYDSSDEDSEED